jgi:hypothetical protein
MITQKIFIGFVSHQNKYIFFQEEVTIGSCPAGLLLQPKAVVRTNCVVERGGYEILLKKKSILNMFVKLRNLSKLLRGVKPFSLGYGLTASN